MAEVRVTVMMPAYNAERYIEDAIVSVLQQSRPDWELVIVNDGSTDATVAIAQSIQDERVKVFHQENSGEAVARNLALDHARGDYLAFLDADDLFISDHLERMLGFLDENPEYQAVYTDGFYIDQDGHRLQKLSSQRRGPFAGDLYEELVRASDVFGPPICTMLSMDLIRTHNLQFDARIVIGPDWDFLTRYAEFGSFGYLESTSCLYRVHETNITVRTGSNKRRLSLAICREKMIKGSGFDRCSLPTRAYVFYDLLINLIWDEPERQMGVTQWRQFQALPEHEQAKLFRNMATNAVLRGVHSEKIGDWIQRAVELSPADNRNRLAATFYRISPGLFRRLLRFRRGLTVSSSSHSPFKISSQVQ